MKAARDATNDRAEIAALRHALELALAALSLRMPEGDHKRVH
jgi:ribonuclease HI